MSDPRAMDTWIERLQAGDTEAETHVCDHFFPYARKVAGWCLSRRLQSRVGASDIANDAMRSVFSAVQQDRSRRWASGDLMRFVVDFTRKEAADWARREFAAKRSPARETPAAAETLPGRELSPEAAAIGHEMYQAVEDFLNRGPDTLRNRILVLGILEELTPAEIAGRLADEFPDSYLPARRTIQVYLREARDELRERFADWAEREETRDPSEELAEALRNALDAPRQFNLDGLNTERVRELTALIEDPQQPIRCFRDLLFHPQPPVELLLQTSQFAKAHASAGRGALPGDVARVLYVAAIAVARQRYGECITRLDDKMLRQGIRWVVGQDWTEDRLAALLLEGVRPRSRETEAE